MSLLCAEVDPLYEKLKKLRKSDVSKILKWLEGVPYLPTLTELQVILFINSCSYDLDMTKKTIENYFSFKTKSDIFVMIDENLAKKASSVAFLGVLPNKTPKDEIVMLLDPDPEMYNCEEFSKYALNYLNLYIHQYGPSNGIVIIMDSENMSFGHFWKMKLSVVRQIMYYIQEAAPVAIKGIHWINVLPVTKHLIVFLKPFIKKEVYDLIKIHPESVESLYEYVPKNSLPEEYGGELDSYNIINEKNVEIFLEKMKLLEWIHAQNIDESKKNVVAKRGFFEHNGKKINQSLAIARYLAKQAKLSGKDDWENLEIDAVVDTVNDLKQKFTPLYFEKDEAKKKTLKDTLTKETVPYYYSRLDEQVKKNKGYLVGGHLTWADFFFATTGPFIDIFLGSDLLSKYSNLKGLVEKVEALPAIKKWIGERPKTEF